MAALKIAFESPENLSGVCPSKARPIDLVHLVTQTMGDKALEIEVLQMFARQTRQLVKDLSGATGEGRVALAHRLKGAALAVGAFAVAGSAEAVERNPDDAASFSALSAAVLDAELFILKLCR